MFCSQDDVQKVLSIATGIPVANLSKGEIYKLRHLPKELKQPLLGFLDSKDSNRSKNSIKRFMYHNIIQVFLS